MDKIEIKYYDSSEEEKMSQGSQPAAAHDVFHNVQVDPEEAKEQKETVVRNKNIPDRQLNQLMSDDSMPQDQDYPQDYAESDLGDDEGEEEDDNVEPQFYQAPENPDDPQVRMKRTALISRINMARNTLSIHERAQHLSPSIDMTTQSLQDLLDAITTAKNAKNGVRIAKLFVLGSASVLEYTSHTYNPFDFTLDGISAHYMQNIDQFDEVLAELYYKYFSKSHMSPEIRFLVLFVTTGVMFKVPTGVDMIGNIANRAATGVFTPQAPPAQPAQPPVQPTQTQVSVDKPTFSKPTTIKPTMSRLRRPSESSDDSRLDRIRNGPAFAPPPSDTDGN